MDYNWFLEFKSNEKRHFATLQKAAEGVADDLEAGLTEDEIELYSEMYKRSHGPTVTNILDF